MRQISILYIIYSLLFISCKTSPKEQTEIIDLAKGLKNTRKINLSEIASEIEYIPLEMTKDSYIGYIEQVKFCNGFVFILDSEAKVIHIYNDKGKHLGKIDKNGKGLGEYIVPSDLEILSNDTSVFIFDREADKLLKYSYKGKLIEEWMIQEQSAGAFSILYDFSFIFLTTFPRNAYNDGYHLSVYDRNVKLLNKLVKKDIVTKEVAFSIPIIGMFTLESYCDTLTYWEHRQDIVYKIIDNKTIYPRYKITYPNPMPLTAKPSDKNNYNALFGFIETCNYMFFWGNYNDDPFRTFYSKKTKEIATNSLKYRDELNYGFINDIDGGFTFYPDDATPDGKLYCTFSLFELKEFLSKKSNVTKVVSEQKRAELMSLVENSKLEDNECIMLVTLK